MFEFRDHGIPKPRGEALYGDGGSGLGGTLEKHQDKFRGVLNGVDYFVWNPETDPFILAPYSAESIARKYEDKGHSETDSGYAERTVPSLPT